MLAINLDYLFGLFVVYSVLVVWLHHLLTSNCCCANTTLP